MKIKITQAVLLLTLSLFSLTASALPPAFTATYSVSKSGMSLGNMNVSLSYSNQSYRYEKNSKARGIASLLSGDRVVENVQGRFQGNHLQPQNYLYHHTSKRKNRKDSFHFNSPQQVVGQYKNKNYKVTVPNNTLDRASLELALARDVSANKAQLNYTVTEKGVIKTYNIKRAGHHQLTIGNAKYNVQKLVVNRKNSQRSTVFWLAKELGYMPARIDHTEKGSVLTSLIKHYQLNR